MRGYSVEVFDRAGTFCETECADFAEALKVLNESRVKYPSKVVRVFNVDRMDLGFDGLTEAEREQLDDMAPIIRASIEYVRARKAAS